MRTEKIFCGFINKRQSKSDVGEGAERLQNILSGFHSKAQTQLDKMRKETTEDRKLKVSAKETKEVKQITSKRDTWDRISYQRTYPRRIIIISVSHHVMTDTEMLLGCI